MKTKPVSHKSENTFRFQTFAERIKNVNIDVVHRIRKITQFPEEADSFFAETLQKWYDLNCTEDFEHLKSEIGYATEVQSLAQVLLKRDHLVHVLKTVLQSPENLAVDVALELVVALARDLQHEFYPYFPKIFSIIVRLLATKDTEMLERSFTCLAYLFKFLWRYMIKDIEDVYSLFSPLLGADQKEYIRNFAAESFSFLMRKVPYKVQLFSFMFQKLTDYPEQVAGVGRLLFEMMKGVKKQFHSCSESVFTILLELLGEGLEREGCAELPFDAIKEALICTCRAMIQHTSKENSVFIWKVFNHTICRLQDAMVLATDVSLKTKVEAHLSRVIQIYYLWVEYKQGVLISSAHDIVETLLIIFKRSVPLLCREPLLQVASAVFLSHVELAGCDARKLMLFILKSDVTSELIFTFVRTIFPCTLFEKDILPMFVSYCDHITVTANSKLVLEVLSELILFKCPMPTTGKDICVEKYSLHTLQKANLDYDTFSANQNLENIHEYLLSTLTSACKDIEHNIFLLVAALVIVPHVDVISREAALSVVKITAEKLLNHVLDLHENEASNTLTFALCQSFLSLQKIDTDSALHLFSKVILLKLLKRYPKRITVLQLADFVITINVKSQRSRIDDQEMFSNVFELLHLNLASPYHMMRLLTLRIFSAFTLPLREIATGETTETNVFQICLNAEMTKPTIQDYREKLRMLQKISYEEVEKYLPVGSYEIVPVLYLIGNLYINFQWLWKPVQKLIESHARAMDKTFWTVFLPQLQNSMEHSFCSSGTEEAASSLKMELSSNYKLRRIFEEKVFAFSQLNDRPDFMNHLCLLWGSVELFADVAEPRNRELVPLFLKCVNEEYFTAKPGYVSVQDLRKTSNSRRKLMKENDKVNGVRKRANYENGVYAKKIKLEMNQDEVLPDANGDEEVNQNEVPPNANGDEEEDQNEVPPNADEDNEEEDFMEDIEPTKKRCKNITKVLLSHLAVFAKFQNPKSLFREKELYDIYMKLLTDKDAKVQKLAFDCIMTYKQRFLTPYKENFYHLLDDKTFKTEVTLFNVDAENGVVQTEHRAELFPVLIRILYGKMNSKTGANTSGKALAGVRRSIILRFLAGCQESELQLFVDLVFYPFKHFISLEPMELMHYIDNTFNLSAVMPIRRQMSSLNMLGVFMKHLGNLAPGLLPQLLKILLSIAKISNKCLETRNELDLAVISRMKSIRSIAFQKLIQFFKDFDNYNFSINEIDAIFDAFVWPLLSRLENESMYYASPLLRLLYVWCENPRYFVLLSRQFPGKDENVLSHIIALYGAHHVQPSVLSTITNMLHNLLCLQDYSNTGNPDSLPLPIFPDYVSQLEEHVNFGTRLLFPHISDILKRLRKELEKVVKNSKKTIGGMEMDVLARISEHVKDPEQSTEVVHLLITSLFKVKTIKDEVQISTLKSIRNLMKQIQEPQHFLIKIAPLFSAIQNRHARNELCSIIKSISDRDTSIRSLYTVVKKLNAWDAKLLEDPDYNARLDGYKLAKEMILDETALKTEAILIIISNCCYFVRTLQDLSLRDGAVYVLQKICSFVSLLLNDSVNFKLLVLDCLLTEIRKGLKEKSETVQRDFVLILSSLLQHCKAHPQLKNLSQLCDSDPDSDFWENICHIQLHRRARAMTRFARSMRTGTLNIPPFQLTAFIMPIISSFLFEKSYAKHTNLIDGAIEAIGAICQRLPWPRYEALLRYYLGLLPKCVEYHKTVVKVVVCILNSFNFDLSNSRGTEFDENQEFNENGAEDGPEELHNDVLEQDDGTVYVSNETITANKETGDDTTISMPRTILSAELATKVHCTITKSLLPELRKSLTERTKSEEVHKLTKKIFAEDEEILRIPIAIAMVKLLQILPQGMLEDNLPGILLRVCSFLKSRAESIREAARETLIKIMDSIGPRYLWYLLHEMKGMMKKGYQVHVMLYTINAVLTHLCDQMKPGDLDRCIEPLSELCHHELFSTMSEEKEVGSILGKLKEARSSKSYIIYQTMGKFITESSFMQLLQPLQDKLLTLHSHKMLRKVQECLQKIVLGLADNEGIKSDSILIRVYHIVANNLSDSNGMNKKLVTNDNTTKIVKNPDTYLIAKEPPRGGIPAKSSKKSNHHILVEFGYKILHFLIKRKKLSPQNKEQLQMLDPFVALLSKCLTSQYVKLISIVLRCISGLLHFPLPSFKVHMLEITQRLFVLLNKYAGAGLAQGDNFEMVVMCFKTLTVIIRDLKYHKINDDQLRVLLIYIEQDMYDHTRQATAFTLLKAILSRRLDSEELQSLMKKVGETCVTSEIDHVRLQCRQAYLQYLLDYPHGKKLRSKLVFVVGQLEYQVASGRESAVELLNAIITVFPTNILNIYSGLLFVPIASRLVNDISPRCRQLAAQAIKKLLSRIDNAEKDNLLSVVVTWMLDIKVAHRRLGAQLCGLFAEIEGDSFERHLETVLPAIEKQLKPENFKKMDNSLDERNIDHLLYHLLNTLLKIFSVCPVIRQKQYVGCLKSIWEQVRICLLYPHAWVRLASAQLFGLMFAQYSVEDLCSSKQNNSSEYLLDDVKQKVKDLASDFCTQLRGAHLVEGLGDQIAKNLVYLGKVALIFACKESMSVNESKASCFDWLLRQMCREATNELIKTPRITVKRSCIFKWLAAISLSMEKDMLLEKLPGMLLPLCKVVNDNSSNADQSLKSLGQEVIDVMKNLVGVELFVEVYSQVETAIAQKRAKRKRDRAIEAVIDPSKLAKRKIKKHERKKEAKKRKFALKKQGKKKA